MGMMPRYQHRSALAELREGLMSLARAAAIRCPECGKPCVDEKALQRHVDVNHPVFPPAEEDCSE